MRFEWLFIGYLLMFQIPVGGITMLPVLAYGIMLFAMLRLSKFEEYFQKAKYVLYVALPIGAALLALQIYKIAVPDASYLWYDYTYNAVRLLSECAEMLTMFFIYLGVKAIGVNTEILSLEKHAGRNMSVMFVYFIFEMIMSLLSVFAPSIFKGYEIILMYPFALGVIWRMLNLWMIISCYFKVTVSDGKTNENGESGSDTADSRHYPKKHKKKKRK